MRKDIKSNIVVAVVSFLLIPFFAQTQNEILQNMHEPTQYSQMNAPSDINITNLNLILPQNFDQISQNYIPNTSTTIKYIKLNFHFFIHPTLKGNFDENDDNYANTIQPYSAYNFVSDIVAKANYYFSHIESMNYNLPNNPIPLIGDSKFRIINSGIYFHYDENISNLTFYQNNTSSYSVNPYYEVNVYFCQKNQSYSWTGVAPSLGIRYIEFNGAWEKYKIHKDIYYSDPVGGAWAQNFTVQEYASSVAHELLHDFGLAHTILTPSGSESRGNNDLISDTPTLDEMSNAYGVHYDDCRNISSPMCSNNFMEYGGGKALTPLQLGRMHYYASQIIPQYVDWSISSNADLYIKDNQQDNGVQPSTDPICWNSPDIWVEDIFGNPLNNPIGGQLCIVNVKIHNKSTSQSSGNNEVLSLHWAKAGVNMVWPKSWDGSSYFNCGKIRGNFIGSSIIPQILPQGETIIKIPWIPPYPVDYSNCIEFESEKWHFCLTALINNGNDPLIKEYEEMGWMTLENNNFAWKNLSVDDASTSRGAPRGVIAISNPSDFTRGIKIKFKAVITENNEYINDFSELRIKLSSHLYNRWVEGGKLGTNIEDIGENTILVKGIEAELVNIVLEPNVDDALVAEIYFLTEFQSLSNVFEFDIYETYEEDDILVGGERFKMYRTNEYFQAMANEDQTIVKGDQVNLEASMIGKSATYNWYDDNKILVYTGTSALVFPQESGDYMLEIIADSNGYKDYDTVNVVVKNGIINSVYPNPTSNFINIDYRLSKSLNNVYVKINNTSGLTLLNLPLDVCLTKKQINISNFPSGIYFIEIVHNNELMDRKVIIKN